MDSATVSFLGIVVSIAIAVVGGSITLAIKLPRFILDLQKRVEKPLGFVTFVGVVFSFGYMQGVPDGSKPPFAWALGLGILAYWLIVFCAVIARYVLSDREERDRSRSEKSTTPHTGDEQSDAE